MDIFDKTAQFNGLAEIRKAVARGGSEPTTARRACGQLRKTCGITFCRNQFSPT